MDSAINLQYTTIKDSLPDFIYESLKNYSSDANAYKPQPEELIRLLTIKHTVPADMLYLTAGCDEAIQMFIHAYGQETAAFTPTYVVYKDAIEFGKTFKEIPSVTNNLFDVNSGKVRNTTLIFLANPNNPSGFTTREKVLDLVKNNTDSIVVIDEAYGEFAPELSVIDEVKNHKNLAVLRSFSKGFGMAGNRVGYIISDSNTISEVKNKAQWSNVSYLSVGAAIAALRHEKYFEKMREEITETREDFTNFLSSKGFCFLPSKINAIIIKFKDKNEGTHFFEFLKDNNIITSHGNGFSNIGLDESYVRIAIGNKEQMEIVKGVIAKFNL